MANMKDMGVARGENLTDLIGRVRLAAKRDDDGAVQAAQFLRLTDDDGASALFMVVAITATRGAVSGETVLTLARLCGDGFPPVAMLSSRSPAPCGVARATDAEVIAQVRALAGDGGVHLNPPAVRPTRADRTGLRPVEFDCAPPVAGKCGTRGQRYEPAETLETVSVLTAEAGAPEWASAVEVASEVLATEPDAPSEPAPVMEPSAEVATDEPATEPSAEPAPVKGKRRKG